MVPLMISSESNNDAIVTALLDDPAVGGSRIIRDRITGSVELATVLITLTPVVLTAVVNVLKAKWDRDSKIVIETKGMKLKGVSPEDAERILKQILKSSQDKK